MQRLRSCACLECEPSHDVPFEAGLVVFGMDVKTGPSSSRRPTLHEPAGEKINGQVH
jgi:hypothetical protein